MHNTELKSQSVSMSKHFSINISYKIMTVIVVIKNGMIINRIIITKAINNKNKLSEFYFYGSQRTYLLTHKNVRNKIPVCHIDCYPLSFSIEVTD